MINNFFKENYKFILKFILVGIFTLIVNVISVTFFFDYISLDRTLSITFSYIIALSVHFSLNGSYTFSSKLTIKSLLKYSALPLINFSIVQIVAYLFVEIFMLPIQLSVFASSLVTASISFLYLRFFTFQINKSEFDKLKN